MLRSRRVVLLPRRVRPAAASARASSSSSLASSVLASTLRSRSTLLTQSRATAALLPRASPQLLVLRRWQSALPQDDAAMAAHLEELTHCRDTGNWRQALQLLDRLDRAGFPLDAGMYEIAIGACARMGKIEVLPGLLQNMAVDALTPTPRTIDFVLQAYIAAEEWQRIVALAKSMSEQHVELSDAALQAAFEACGKTGDAQGAKELLTKAAFARAKSSQGREPLDAAHFAAAIRACGMCGRPDLATAVFRFMESPAGGGAVADAEVFNQLIRSQIVHAALPQAMQTFSLVQDRDVPLPESIFTATIDALVKHGEHWHATQLFSQMLARGLSPSVFCYGRMMVAYVRLNKHDVARECWDVIARTDEPRPHLTKYAKMVAELGPTNDSELLATVFEFLFQRFDAAQIRDSTYALAIRAYGRLGDTDQALQLFDAFVASRRRAGRRLPRSAGVYVAVFNALSRDTAREPAQNTRDAKRVWDLMLQHVPVVLPPAYASLAGVLASSGDLSTLDELLRQAESTFRQQQLAEEQQQQQQQQQQHGQQHPRARRSFRDGAKAAISADQAFFLDDLEAHALGHPDVDDELDDDSLDDVLALDEPFASTSTSASVSSASASSASTSALWSDELLFNGVISGFSKARSDETARIVSYLELMRARGLPIKDSVVRAATDAFVRHAQWDQMSALLALVEPRVLANADTCFGDTISKLLEAQAWGPAREWIARAHHQGVSPPIRGKMEVLQQLRAGDADEWQIAYALARETLSFKMMVAENVESVADAMAVCSNAGRADLVVKLYEWTAQHPSLRGAAPNSPPRLVLPLRMYKLALLNAMREHTLSGGAPSAKAKGKAKPGNNNNNASVTPIAKAASICTQMLQQHRRDALDGDALSLAISIKATMGDDDDVLALFEKMRQHGLAPNSYAFNAAIVAYSRAGRLDQVLAVRDALLADEALAPILREPKVTGSLLFSLAILQDDALLRRHLDETLAKLPHVTKEQVFAAFLQANRLDLCVELFDESVPAALFYPVLRRLLDAPVTPANITAMPALVAELTLKFMAHHGADQITPRGLLLKINKYLLQHGALRESEAILALLTDPRGEFPLADTSASFQREVTEMQLFVYGEQRRVDDLVAMLERSSKALPLSVRHFQVAMEYCVQARDDLGALACLKLFEALRLQFVKPNGAVYVLALQSSRRLGRLDVTGKRVIKDAMEQGFERLVSSELYRLANVAEYERRDLPATRPKPRGRGRPRLDEAKRDDEDSARTMQVEDVGELAALTIFCHHQGVEISAKLAHKLLELRALLPAHIANELEHVAAQHELSARRPSSPRAPPSSSAVDGERATRRTDRSGPAGARWGDLYLQRLASDE
ncbi:hypothetical protein ATCC90586_010214 [Pythium insidiosum]|nr:hypothetical protein ATCC90586_010214 [Pythium insidiosum]